MGILNLMRKKKKLKYFLEKKKIMKLEKNMIIMDVYYLKENSDIKINGKEK